MSFTIRAATPDDRDALAALNAEVQRLHASNRPDDFKPASKGELASWFAAVLEDRSATVWVTSLASGSWLAS